MQLSLICLFVCVASAVTSAFVFQTPSPYEDAAEKPDQDAVYHVDNLLQHHHSRPRTRRTTMRRCGNVLIMAIIKICDGCLAQPEKRSVSKRAVKRALTDECCAKPCSEEDLKQFCCSA
ncbi:IlGF domain-containing protein [Aphelenchoides bicaudatus]|nr:IlGF domain-containing protein [Aphelenchoides bicaudatus]